MNVAPKSALARCALARTRRNGPGFCPASTTAEGVETREQLDKITSEGCTEMQGYLFSKPLPAPEIERLFLSGHAARNVPGRIVAA